jgi:ubiquinone/menaquinone biosynthesis C-methylase UbiE
MSQSDAYRGYKGDAARKEEHLRRMAVENMERKQRTYAWMGVQSGHHVLDVGCGAGMDTLPLAQIVGPTGRVVGIDVDEAMLLKADERAREAGVGDWVEHRLADAAALPFEDDSFDALHSERVFMHLHNPEQVLAEMVRVAKSGAALVVIDVDGASISFDITEEDLERRYTPFWAALHENPYAGRQLYRLAITAGLADVEVHVTPIVIHDLDMARYQMKTADVEAAALAAGGLTQAEIDRVHASVERAAEQDAFYCCFNTVTVVGRKP